MATEKTAKLLYDLFVNRDDAYADAYIGEDKSRMSYAKKDRLIDVPLIETHLLGEQTLGVYLLKGKKVKLGCFDFDRNTKEDFEDAKKLHVFLKEQGYHPLFEMSGGGEYKCHVWIFAVANAGDMMCFLEDCCEKSGIEPHEKFPKQEETKKGYLKYGNLIKLPLALHLVSGRRSFFLNDKFEIAENDKILQYHLDNKDTIPRFIIKEKIVNKFSIQDRNPSEFDAFFNFVLNNNLPSGKTATDKKYQKITGVNDNILKNEAIWLKQKGYSLEELEAEIKPVYNKNGWAFGEAGEAESPTTLFDGRYKVLDHLYDINELWDKLK